MSGCSATFFQIHVLPSICDYLEHETELHRAMAVATNLTHLADWFYDEFHRDSSRVLHATNVSHFRKVLSQRSQDYALLRDVCDAHKHLRLDRPDRSVTSAGQSTIMSLGWGESKWGDARWGSPEEVVVVDDFGEKHHFRGLVLRTKKMWEDMLGITNDA